jgi:WD40 repeat protein
MRTFELSRRVSALALAISTAAVCPWTSLRQDASSDLPRPSFVLHDKKLHPEKPHMILSPKGSFTMNAGTSMIEVSSLSFSADGKTLAVGSTPGIVDVWKTTRSKA